MLSITSASSLSLPMIDMMTAHDEIPMLRYRLRLHAPLAIKTIILEGNLSHAGYPKPLHVRNSLTAEEIEKYKVEIHNVPFGPDLEQRMTSCRNGTNVKCTWILEVTQRKFIMSMLQPTIDRTLKEYGLDDILVHMSDLDELLDVDAVRNLSLPGCVSPKLRNFVYGEHCPATYPPWSRSVMFRYKSGWLQRHAGPNLQLRKLAKGKECNPSFDWLGWHFGYFMSTERIVHKLSNFAHANDPFIRRITHGPQPIEDMSRRVRKCLDVHGRHYGPAWAAYDGKLPNTPGWPRNVAAPLTFNMSFLEKERRMHEKEVAKLGAHAAAKKAAGTKLPATMGEKPDPSAFASWVLGAARGRLASTVKAIEEGRG